MSKHQFRSRAHFKLLLSSALAGGLTTPAAAQQALFEQEDDNGVDVVQSTTRIAGPTISVGEKSSTSLTASVIFTTYGLELDLVPRMVAAIAVFPTPQSSTVYWRGQVDTFIDTAPLAAPAPIFVSQKQDGPTLTCATYSSPCTYKTENGTEVDFVQNSQLLPGKKPSAIRFPDGERIDFKNYTSTQGLATSTPLGPRYSFLGMESNLGFGIGLTLAPGQLGDQDFGGRYLWDSIFTYNRTVDNCSTTNCNFAQTPPAVTRTGSRTITDPNGGLWQWTTPPDSGDFGLTSLRTPSSTGTDAMTFVTNGSGQYLVSRGGQTWTYTFNSSTSANPVTGTTTVVDPLSGTTVYNHSGGRVTSVQDPLNRVTNYGYDAAYRLTSATASEGNVTQYAYDARGNVTSTTLFPKPGSPLPTITTSASFSATCTSAASCNKPIYTRDANANQTDYTYDATTGLVTTVTAPAATTGGVRPQARYSYTGLQAYLKDGGSAIVATGQPVQKLTGISNCQTTASCTGAVDEAKTTINYGTQTAGTANNLLPASQTKASGTGSVTATVAYGYDAVGNVTAVDGPLAGIGDTTVMRYDAARQLVGIILPDPDGTGTRKSTAERITYDGDGRTTLSETGVVDGTTNANWTAFASSEQLATIYDINGNPVKESKTAGGTTYAITQLSYDALGRVDCVAQRMDPAQWPGQTIACTPQTTGANGPDRVTKTYYNAASQLTKVQAGVGTVDISDEVTNTYSNNGKVATTKDAENNLTTYVYDGNDRLSQTLFPFTTKGAGASNANDYEQLSYDINNNITQRRLRDATLINYGYDKLNRLVSKDLPSTEPDATFTYDLLSRTKTAVQNAQTLTFNYDALSRNISQVGPIGTVSYQYDLASRRTRITYPGTTSLYVQYVYDTAGNVLELRENGLTTAVGKLAIYAYNNLGRRTSATYGNGTTRSYAYDSVSRLSTLTNNLAGTSNDQTTTFTYNPASQLDILTKSNDAFAWNGHYNVDRPYVANGLNQLTAAGATVLGYDARGNLTSSGTNAYTYSSENFLNTGPASAALTYDPAGRLYQTAGAGVTTRFLYDGQNMIAEYNASNALQRRYVHGPGTDDPILWYQGSVLTGKRYLMSDERGSITSVSDTAGALLATNRYDEYGIPASTNLGRFGYTGQTWLPELGMNYYKARIYSPTLGRFMQTDPIGYGDGMSWYNYVGSDPVNRTDTSGTFSFPNGNGIDENDGQSNSGPEIVVTGSRYTTSLGGGFDFGSAVPSLGTSLGFQSNFAGNSWLDKQGLKLGMSTKPQIEKNLRALAKRLLGTKFTEKKFQQIKKEILNSLKLSEAKVLPSKAPSANSPLVLTNTQKQILLDVVGRFDDSGLSRDLLDGFQQAEKNKSIIIK